MQVQALGQGGAAQGAYTGVGQALVKIAKEEGILAYWKGNGVNIIRIFPYSAAQLAANDQYKAFLADDNGNLTTARRLVAGGLAGMTGTALTHPLDTVRLRLAMPNSGYSGPIHAARSMIAKEGAGSMFKGIFPTLVGVAPYTALNFFSFDTINNKIAEAGVPPGVVTKLFVGAAAGTVATTVCYPLDTVRRRMQMAGNTYSSMGNALVTIASKEGFINGFYQGWWANTVKVVPQNAIRLVMYGVLKDVLGLEKAKTDTVRPRALLGACAHARMDARDLRRLERVRCC